MEGFELIETGLWSILPPLIAIALALITKEVYSSLTVGVLSGMMIYAFSSGGGVISGIDLSLRMMAEQLGNNGYLVLFLALLGALVVVITMAGGSRAYGKWAFSKIKAPTGAKIATGVLGLLIFIDDYFNCLTVGTVMRPVTDRHAISRPKLAYLIDATAAPICIIAPISSWAAAVAGSLGEGGFTAFVQAIPYNLYALLTITMVIFLCLTKFDFGPMAKAQREARAIADDPDAVDQSDFNGIPVSSKGRVFDLIIPIAALIIFAILGMAYVGGFFSGTPFIDAIGENPSAGLALGAFGALIVALILFIPRRLMTFKGFMDGVVEGMKSMLPAIMILVLAWSLSGICRYMIGTGEFVSSLVSGSTFVISLLPVIVFLIAAFLSFSMGTAWGTFGILLPIVMTICVDTPNMLLPAMGATLAGSVFGDHCSPISDTTILSSTGAKCDHIQHVSTQMPYALVVAAVCAVGYLISGFIGN
nr:Na+/H+ antiporter NhaC family protein [bacterium]